MTHKSCVYALNYHLVFVTKYRNKVITNQILGFLKKTFIDLAVKWGCEVKEFNGEQDHVHLLISCHPNLNLSKMINNFKTVSSRRVRKEYKEHVGKFYCKPYFWTRAYFITSCGGAPLENIKKYIENQKKIK